VIAAPPSAPTLSAEPSVPLASPPRISTPVMTLPVAGPFEPPTIESTSLVAVGVSSSTLIVIVAGSVSPSTAM
jgi:hypothetical protein